jgi:hypothetical protein
MDIINAQFSRVYFIGSVLSYLSGILTIVAFCSPYWAQYDRQRNPNSRFLNIGLWQACFKNFRHVTSSSRISSVVNKKQTFTGCYYLSSNDISSIRQWLKPGKYDKKNIACVRKV